MLLEHGLPLERVLILTEGTDATPQGVCGKTSILNAVDLMGKLITKFKPAKDVMKEDEDLFIDGMLKGCKVIFFIYLKYLKRYHLVYKWARFCAAFNDIRKLRTRFATHYDCKNSYVETGYP